MQISPTKPQFDYSMSTAQYPALVSGFGAGKTQGALWRCVVGKLKYPDQDRGFYMPTYDLIRMIAFPRFEAVLYEMGIPFRLFKSPLNYIEIFGKGKIYFRSMDAPHRIIGYEHADADVDELDTMKMEDAAYAWRQIVARNRQVKPDKSKNTIGCTTTPEGFKFVYQTWKKDPKEGYEIIQAATYSNPYLPDDYIDTLRRIYPPNLLDAYIEGQFVNLVSGSVYPDFCQIKNGTDMTLAKADEILGKKAAVHIGMDFNVNKMSGVVHVIIKGKVYAIDEFMGLRDTPSMIDAINARYKDRIVMVYPDASGGSADTRNAGDTDISLLEKHFTIIADAANPRIRDRVNGLCAMILNGDGLRRYFVNVDLCPVSVDSLSQQIWGKDGKPDKAHDKDHPNDAIGYFIYARYPIQSRVSTVSKFRM